MMVRYLTISKLAVFRGGQSPKRKNPSELAKTKSLK